MKKFFYCALLTLATVFTGCYDDDDLWNRIDDLTGRVETIEEMLQGLNTEITDIKTVVSALNKGAVITAVEETPQGYRLTFSDGKVIELHHGINGIDGENAPVIGVKEDVDGVYYWTITVNGVTEWLLDSNGNKLRVTGKDGEKGDKGDKGDQGETGPMGPTGPAGQDGEKGDKGDKGETGPMGPTGPAGQDGQDGVTPVIGVDAEGYWTIDTGNGPERIVDANGHYVRAIGISGDSFFTNVVVGEDEVIFYLASGETFSVYRVDNFGIMIDTTDVEVAQGTTKEFAMTLTKVSTVFVASVSEGWDAVVKGDVLYVTAPSEIDDENIVGEINIIAANKRGDCRAFTLECVAASAMRILTFEDADARFTPYTLDYAGVTVEKWSDLIDSSQYNGPLTYDFGGGTYYWYDEGNTELFHSFVTPYWGGGHAISNYVIENYETLPEGYWGWYELQFSNPIGGHNGSSNFAVHNGYKDFYNSQIYDAELQGFEFADGVARVVDHMYVTNINYVLNSLTYGDGFNTPATESTYLKVIAYGFNGEESTGQAEIYLCKDGRLITTWEKFDLSSLGKVTKIVFNFEASEDQSGQYGLNCPAYFAYDDVAVVM